jgi:release factor glutamine methyltransferase
MIVTKNRTILNFTNNMKIASNKIGDVIKFFRDELKDSYDNGEIETFIEYCFEEYLKIKRTEIKLLLNDTMSESDLLKFNFAVKDLKQNKPIQYILGKADFYGLKFKVNGYVLIPRPETEELVDLIVKENQEASIKNQDLMVLDIGTGSGCIPISLKNHIPSAKIYALDVSEKALEVAKQNAEINNVEINFIEDDILKLSIINHHLTFHLIVSNPPYICISEKEFMHKNVLDHEPHLALFVEDNDPLLFYKVIADFALKQLKPLGKLYFEINQAYGTETQQMLKSKGFKNVKLIKDMNGKNRILRGNI